MKQVFFYFVLGLCISVCWCFSPVKPAYASVVYIQKWHTLRQNTETPIAILTRDIPQEELKIETKGIALRHLDDYHYMAKPDQKGEGFIKVSWRNYSNEYWFKLK